MNDSDQASGYGGVWVVVWQNADIADTLHIRDVAMAAAFWQIWLSMGYNFGCVIVNATIVDPRGEFLGEAIPWRQ